MKSDKKFIEDVYTVQNFSNYFNLYTRFLIGLVSLVIIIRGAMWRLGGFFNNALFPYIRIILVVVSITLIFLVPYILWVLIRENKKGWIIGLVLSVIFPFLFVLLIFGVKIFYNQAMLFPLLLYTIYCYMLNSEVKEWLSEYYSHQNRLEQKRLKEERIKNGLWD